MPSTNGKILDKYGYTFWEIKENIEYLGDINTDLANLKISAVKTVRSAGYLLLGLKINLFHNLNKILLKG